MKSERTNQTEPWEALTFEQKVEIDMALDQGNKVEAVKRCMCANKDFTMLTAKSFVDRRAAELAKREIRGKS
jgi:hypothetical protein